MKKTFHNGIKDKANFVYDKCLTMSYGAISVKPFWG